MIWVKGGVLIYQLQVVTDEVRCRPMPVRGLEEIWGRAFP